MTSRAKIGQQVAGTLGPSIARAIETTEAISPELGRMLVEFGFGDAYITGSLNNRSREIATIAALAAMGGCEGPLKTHLGAAHTVGVDPSELLDVLVHLVPIIGFAKVLVAAATFVQWRRDLELGRA
jgi:4-carboxymuconolactone decarboxylase